MEREIRLSILYSEYGKERFINWCRSLNVFRFCKAHPYPDDLAPDRFLAVLNFKNREALINLLSSLAVKFKETNLDIYLEQNKNKVFYGRAKICDSSCFITINEVTGNIEIEVSGVEEDPFALEDSTFLRALIIDEFLRKLELDFSSSPYEDNYCISPEFYPEVWEK